MKFRKNVLTLAAGVLIGMAMAGPTAHAAVEYLKALPSTQSIYLDGQQVTLEAYSINGNNYVKLRDIGEALDFNVYWDGAVIIESDAPYTGVAPAQPQPETPAAPPQPTVTTPSEPEDYTISTEHWSREDFSRSANPAVFTGVYDRELYNVMRQTLVDMGNQDAAGYRYAYTMVSDSEYSAVKNLMGRMDGSKVHDHHVPQNLRNYYEYLDYFAMSAETPDNYSEALDFIRPAIETAKRLGTDSEKVEYLNDYLKTLLEYDRNGISGITQTFAPHNGELKGACGAYASAFQILCSEAGIPCFTISTHDHIWNLVYADGEWLHVDVSLNDFPAGNILLLEESALSRIDVAPEATEFLKELLVPGSTK